jgi:hypothetical protein
MLTQADTRSGIWNGSAGALAGELVIPPRTARNVLESLDGRYIRRFAKPGLHFCYPVLLNKFLITDGEHKGEHLNALESTSPTDLRYFSREQVVEHMGEHMGEQMATQKRIETGDLRLKALSERFEEVWTAYPKKIGKPSAKKAFLAIPGVAQHTSEIILGIERWKPSQQWEDPRYIPKLANFLKDRSWEDEIPERKSGNGNGQGHSPSPAAVPAQPGKYDGKTGVVLSNRVQ